MAKINVIVPDGQHCNDGLRCRYLVFSGDDPRCLLFGQALKYEGSDSAYVEKAGRCRVESNDNCDRP